MIVRPCPQCGQKNRLAPAHLADRGKCGACGAELGAIAEPLNVDAEDFDAITRESKVPVLIDFWADWCGPCHRAAPEVARTAAAMAGKAVVLKVDTEAHPELAARHGVRGIPNFVVYSGGKPVMQQAGAVDARRMMSWLGA